MSPDFVRGANPGFELENEKLLRTPHWALGHVPWRPGFPDFLEPPRFLFDQKLGRPPRDFEQYDVYWVVSNRMKVVLETIDPDGVTFLKCDVHLPDGQPGPDRWFCDVLRILDAVDENASSMQIKYEGTRKIYGLMGRPNMVFKEDAVGPAHLFRMAFSYGNIVCDNEMKSACKTAGLKGIWFQDAIRKYKMTFFAISGALNDKISIGIGPKIEMSCCMNRLNLRFGIILSAALLLVVGAGVAAMEHFSGDSDYPYMEVTPGAHVPKLTLHKTIHLEWGAGAIADMRFSPDNRYIAIGYSRSLTDHGIKIWDLQLNREQANISCTKADPFCVDIPRRAHILWNSDGRAISLGTGPRWDALTGQSLPPDSLERQYSGRLDKFGTKMITINSYDFEHPNFVNIYDIANKTSKKIFVDPFHILSAVWTSEDKILVGVRAMPKNIGQTIDGFTFSNTGDAGFLLIDPQGKQPSKSIWFRGIAAGAPYTGQYRQTNSGLTYENSFVTSQVSLDPPNIIDDRTLIIRSYYSNAEFSNLKFHPGTGGMVFTPDGKYLFLRNFDWFDGREPVTNVIIDAINFREIAKFGGERGTGYSGIAISPDGTMLALGHGDSVQILNMQN